jgi:TP901 family phage tail tape measure protein
MTGTNFEMNASTNIQSVAQKIIKNLGNISNQFEDLVDLLADFTTASAQAGGAMGKIGQSSKGAVTDVQKLKKALSEGGASARRLIKDLNFKDVNLSKLSAKEIEQFSKALREAGSSLSGFLSGNVIGEFDRADKAVKGLAQELDGLAGVSKQSGSTPLLALADLTENREEAKRLLGTIEQLKQELKNIGPAAESGNQKAIQDYQRMTSELDDATRKAEGLKVALKETANIFKAAVGGVNQSLTQGGFQPITLEDIFPSSEQRKVDEMQRKISAAVSENVRTGAVQKTLQFFTGTGREATDVTERLDRNIVQLTSHLPRMRYALYDVSNSLAVFGGGLLAASVGAIKLSADFDRAFADVIRTTGLAGDEVEDEAKKLQRSLIDISQELPIAFGDVAEIATLAGQLNIANESIGNFTENVAKFASTTDVTVEAAATAFGRLDQLVEGVNGQFDKLGSSILAVGVNAVATESDIIAIATQIASVANIAGFSASELIGFSSALASVGTRPELARGTFTRLFTEIQQSVAEGGDQLNAFAQTAGQSVDQFTQAWGEGSGADQVLAILRGLQAEGKTADQTLAQLGITSVRDVPTLLKLAQSVEEVDKQIRIANLGFAEGTELNEQYSVITSTLSEKVQVLKNNLAALGAAFGSASGPLTAVVDLLIGIIKAFEEILDNPINSFIAGFITSFVGFIGVLGLFGSLVARVAGGFVGFATALIEGFEAIGLMKVSMDQATVSTAANTGATESNKKSKIALAIENYKAARAQQVETAATNADTAAKNGLTAATTRAIAATRAFKFAIGGLGVGLVVTGVFLLVDALFQQAGAAEDAANANEKLAESLGDISPFMAAIEKDTENYRKATMEARKEFDTFGGSVKANNLEISDRGAILAVVTGQEDLLAGSVGKSADQIERQTLAIGENTEALIRQRIAQDLANDALEDGLDLRGIQEAVRASELIDAPAGTVSFEARQIAREQVGRVGNQAGLQSVFEIVSDPELSAALSQAGFDFQEYINAVVSGNEELATSVLTELKPAAEELLRTAEEGSEVETYLRGVVEFGTSSLANYTSVGGQLRDSIKRLVFEQKLLGGAFEETSPAVEDFREALKSSFEGAFGPINAQREMEESVRNLGAAFAEQAPEIVVNSQDMQDAIAGIIDTASNEEEAIEGLSGLYNAIVDGGYASREQLELVAEEIRNTYRAAAQAQILLLQQERDAFALRRELTESRRGVGAPVAKEIGRYNSLIRAQQEIIDNVENIDITTRSSAEAANLLAQGYSSARDEAAGAAEEIEEVEEKTRTLLDYASDLESVFSRAFDLRFGRQSVIDELTEAWESFSEQVENAKQNLEELQATQQDLAADRAIKEYFLSVAEAYDDQLRAAKLRAEIADLDNKSAEAARELAEAQETAAGATALTGQGPGARQNRQALLGLVRNYQDYITTLAESGASQDELRKATERARKEFIAQATDLGFAESEVMMYAAAFDDVRTAIDRVPRDITVDFNADPALQALNELNAKLDQSIEKAKELNRQTGTEAGPPNSSFDPPTFSKNITDASEGFRAAQYARTVATTAAEMNDAVERLRFAQRALRGGFSSGGYTGSGGKYQPAGVVHRGEYVVPSQYVNQSSGLPNANFLSQLQNGMRGYAQGGFVGGGMGDGTMMVELSPFDRKLLSDAGNVQLRVDGKVVASATNRSNFNEARRGSN